MKPVSCVDARVLVPALLLFCAPASGQDATAMPMPKPAPELKQYEPMIGSWEGVGEVLPAPDAKPVAWTSQSSVQWVLGGFFVEERLKISFGDAFPGMSMHNFYGYDTDGKHCTMLGVTSKGEADVAKVGWTDANTLVGVSTGTQQGKPYAERWRLRFAKDTCEIKVDRAVGDGPFHAHVTGRFTRSKTVPAAFTLDQKAAPGGSAELKKLDPLLGTWQVKGRMIPAPGAPEMAISGTETVTAALGGTTLFSHTKGDPIPGMPGSYESYGYYLWDAAERAYDMIYVSNMGEAGKMEGRFTEDGALVWTHAQRQNGISAAGRAVQTFKNGGVQFTSDRFTGTAAAFRDFSAEYTRAK